MTARHCGFNLPAMVFGPSNAVPMPPLSLTRRRAARKNAAIVMLSLRRFLGSWQLCVWAFAILVAPSLSTAAEKKNEPKPTVAVVSIQIPPALAADRTAIESSVTKGLDSAGWIVLDLAETARRVGERHDLLQCSGEVCAIEIARVAKTVYQVRAEVNGSKRKYAISLKILDAADGAKPMAREHAECSAKDVASKLALAAEFAGRDALAILDDLAHPDVVPGSKRPVVAVVSVKLPPSAYEDRDGIESGLARGLDLAGWQVLDVSETNRLIADRKDLWDCTSELCTLEIGRLTKAPYVVRAGVKTGKTRYTVNLSLFDSANPSKPMVREDEECLEADPDCPLMARKISLAARILGRKAIRIVQESAPQLAIPSTPTVLNPSLPSAPVDPGANSRADMSQAEPPPHSSLRIAGWVTIGVGAALLVGSAVEFIYDGKKADCQNTPAGERCFQRYDNKTRGYLLGGAGLASALIGGYIVLFPGRAYPTTVAFSSRGILVGGEF